MWQDTVERGVPASSRRQGQQGLKASSLSRGHVPSATQLVAQKPGFSDPEEPALAALLGMGSDTL